MTDIKEESTPTLEFNGSTYVIDDLSDSAKYMVNQIQDMNSQINQSKARLDQLTVGKDGFIDLLKKELDSGEPGAM